MESSTLTTRKPLVNKDWLDFVLAHLDPTLSVTRTKARLQSIVPETSDIKTFVFRPNRRFHGFAPGQYLPVRIILGGIVHERSYSLTGEPGAETVSITVKRIHGGRVSSWLHDDAQIGDVIEIGTAEGAFTLPEVMPAKMLFLAGGSGITPVFSLIRAALRKHSAANITLLYYGRTVSDFAFEGELTQLQSDHKNFRFLTIPEWPHPAVRVAGRFEARHLAQCVPDYAQREAFLCGPTGFMQAVTRLWKSEACAGRLHVEWFGPVVEHGAATAIVPVNFRRSQRTVVNDKPTLLETAEAAGIKPAYGCRMGICKTCVCTKVSGITRDRVTGQVNQAPNSRIKICTSEPLGPVTLDL